MSCIVTNMREIQDVNEDICIYTHSHTLRKMPRIAGTDPMFQK